MKESTACIADAKQAVQAAGAHGLELPKGSQGKVSKDRAREGGCNHLVDVLLTDWWRGDMVLFQESQSSIF